MKGKIFEVVLFANMERCDLPGYRQWAEVLDENDKCVGVWNYEPSPGEIPYPEMKFGVMSRLVHSDAGPVEALRRFNEWKEKGYPETWLIEGRDEN